MAWALPAPLAFSSMPPNRLMPSQIARPAATMPPGMAQTLSGIWRLMLWTSALLYQGLVIQLPALSFLPKASLG